MERPELSAIVLCYRAGPSILRVIEPLHEELQAADVAYELVLVANYHEGNDDPTPRIVEEFAQTHEHVRFVAGVKQGAMGWDMRSGFAVARGDYLVAIDGDAQNPVEDLVKMYREMKSTGAEVMKGRRIARFDGPYRRVVSWVYNTLFKVLFGTHGLWDINGKPKGLTRRAYEQLELRSDDWFIDAEIMISARRRGLSIAEMPVVFRRNDDRASFVRVSAIWEFLANMARARISR
ncbi:MAG: polyisoprenyl-phosphate glycosyltransferase [Solirubrobacteraceae bacterium]|jgi:glycosyltransferase involved in cell wall biosynthesis|nr:polyisoprenyl-phosphate glycosyltransferase [Solirubrobacteraceae bacterium]